MSQNCFLLNQDPPLRPSPPPAAAVQETTTPSGLPPSFPPSLLRLRHTHVHPEPLLRNRRRPHALPSSEFLLPPRLSCAPLPMRSVRALTVLAWGVGTCSWCGCGHVRSGRGTGRGGDDGGSSGRGGGKGSSRLLRGELLLLPGHVRDQGGGGGGRGGSGLVND